MSDKERVLFICVHNSARSQFAEAYLREIGSQWFSVESAGLDPGELNPYVVQVLKEDGIDISGKKTQSVKDVYDRGVKFSYIITVCDRVTEKNCPVYPQPAQHLSWSFPDPEKLECSDEEMQSKVREIADVIKMKIRQFVNDYKSKL
ncbi:MAG: arsenate reductase ArsC [Spirochaetales bacterium]|uniref:Arsenate reductase ArsC n=1 Tax=Candidatus Thalassospirochaeta sargassi TaxID=3119039 RepID=A0AAJ1MNA7_9SPIO|nr:arsenate reductase ArsC [Spirochaetales bacterium]